MPGDTWKFAVTGQSLIKRDLRQYANAVGHAEVIGGLQSADVAFTNFEGTITGSFGGWPTKNKAFSAPGGYALDTLEQMGFNMVSLTNNHAFDLGPSGILSTLEQMSDRSMLYAGIGVTGKDAAKPRYRSLDGGRVALVAADCGPQPEYVYAFDGTDRIPSRPGNNRLLISRDTAGHLAPDATDAAQFLRHITEAAAQADFVVAYLHSHHWEPNPETTPVWIQAFAKQCIDHGAHAFVCHGVPILQGVEIYKKRPILYGLGNFIFHTYQSNRWKNQFGMKPWQSVVADCTYDSDGNLREIAFYPIVVGGDPDEMTTGTYTELDAPSSADPKSGQEILNRLAYLSRTFNTHMEIKDNHAMVFIER